ncbi:MAG TPA: hypothetical protein PK530_01920 [Anaerolineales bacterium]|nr:hypothetical protein [Anaerolineales bacterium]
MHEPINTTKISLTQPEPLASGKVYTPPVILYELELETRAGSPLAPNGLDPLGLNEPFTVP